MRARFGSLAGSKGPKTSHCGDHAQGTIRKARPRLPGAPETRETGSSVPQRLRALAVTEADTGARIQGRASCGGREQALPARGGPKKAGNRPEPELRSPGLQRAVVERDRTPAEPPSKARHAAAQPFPPRLPPAMGRTESGPGGKRASRPSWRVAQSGNKRHDCGPEACNRWPEVLTRPIHARRARGGDIPPPVPAVVRRDVGDGDHPVRACLRVPQLRGRGREAPPRPREGRGDWRVGSARRGHSYATSTGRLRCAHRPHQSLRAVSERGKPQATKAGDFREPHGTIHAAVIACVPHHSPGPVELA